MTIDSPSAMPIEILLVEDSPGDVRLTREALKDAKVCNNLSVASDGVEAMDFLRRRGRYADAPCPDLILLDLNMPRMDGRDVLAEIKADPELKRIPVVILTTSEAEQDILASYALHANCYIAKPVDLEQFLNVVRQVESFWLSIVKLPPPPTGGQTPEPTTRSASRADAPADVLVADGGPRRPAAGRRC